VFGIVAIFVSIPSNNIIYDFNRLRRARADGAVVIAASIFLYVFNVFPFWPYLLGGELH
jgi:FtsH-binding integral membrane protein